MMRTMMKLSNEKWLIILLLLIFPTINILAAVPEVMNYQGTVRDSGGAPINGMGYFKFAIVDQPGSNATTAYWSNSGTPGLTEPPDAVSVNVSNGIFTVKLGDNANLAHMAALPPSVFDNASLYLRVWFSTLQGGPYEQFATDIQIVSAGFAFKAANADRAAVADQVTSVDWSELANVPADIADGDDGITSETDPTVPASIKDGIAWSELSGIPAGFADGVDNGITSESDPTVPASIKDGIAWSELSGIPAGFADGVDNGITSESDPQVGTLTNGRWCTSDGSTVNCTTSLTPSGNLWTQSGSNIYYDSGSVGVGSANIGLIPGSSQYLSVTTSGPYDPSSVTSIEIAGNSNAGNSPHAKIDFVNPLSISATNTARIEVRTSSGSTAQGQMLFYTNGGSLTERMRITQLGNVGIGNSSPNVALDVTGDIEYTGTITDVSDERLKENILPIVDALEKILAINGVSYNMIDTPDKREIGVIAQNIQNVIPEAVSVVDPYNGYLGVSYVSIIPVLIEAIKEQQKQIEELKKQLNGLE